jgi:DedD protein
MYTRPDPPDPAVDELKRRARRRLVGAVVLALAAAVILPLLLESDPKPLGDDVSIQIPPVDTGKFVNPLSPAPPKTTDAKTEAARDSKPAATERAASSKADAAPKAPAKDVEQRPLTQTAPAPASTVDASPASAAQPKASSAESKPEPSVASGFVIQVAALADAKAASDLASKLKAGGYPGYMEAFATAQGAMQRVRVGPYPSRDAADAALAKLKASGYDGIVANAK